MLITSNAKIPNVAVRSVLIHMSPCFEYVTKRQSTRKATFGLRVYVQVASEVNVPAKTDRISSAAEMRIMLDAIVLLLKWAVQC